MVPFGLIGDNPKSLKIKSSKWVLKPEALIFTFAKFSSTKYEEIC